MQKQIFIRLCDLALLAMLVSQYQSAKTFAVIMISIMTALMVVGGIGMGMSKDVAAKIAPKSAIRQTLGIAVHALYVGALIYAGYPVLAALYATSSALVRLAAHSRLQAKEVN